MRKQKQGEKPISDYVSGKVLYTSEEKSLTVAGQDAVEYRLGYEGPPSLKTQFYKDDLVYIISYTDTTNPDFDKYLDDYRAIQLNHSALTNPAFLSLLFQSDRTKDGISWCARTQSYV